MASNLFAIIMPCQSVVARNDLGGLGWGLDVKKRLLEVEAKRALAELMPLGDPSSD